MSARARIHALFGTLDEAAETDLDRRLDAVVTEALAADRQAYTGELAMYRSLVRTLRTLRTVIRDGGSAEKQRAEVQRLLHEHANDDAAARAQGGEGR